MSELSAFPHECTVDGCDEAYPHRLLLDKHLLDDHQDKVDELDKYISGELPKIGR